MGEIDCAWISIIVKVPLAKLAIPIAPPAVYRGVVNVLTPDGRNGAGVFEPCCHFNGVGIQRQVRPLRNVTVTKTVEVEIVAFAPAKEIVSRIVDRGCDRRSCDSAAM